jgi:16S rRNA (adenine1518-N6/adenine1519-N6)-dimethyltransferase
MADIEIIGFSSSGAALGPLNSATREASMSFPTPPSPLTYKEKNPSPRQTLSYLQQLFQGRGLEPKSKLGQCFLIDLNLMDLLLRSAELTETDLAVEIGSGTASLTLKLAEAAGAVVGMEIDQGFYMLAHDLTQAWSHVRLLHGDVLKNKNRLNPEFVATLVEMSRQPGIRRVKLVANLPYVVATPVVINLLLLDEPQLERMVVMVQLEMAERLLAKPSTKEYNASSVFVQSLCDVEMIRRIGPKAFFPLPRVDSAIIRIWPRPQKRAAVMAAVGSVGRLHRLLHGLYLHRRKNLRGALLPLFRDQMDKPQLDALLSANGFDGKRRAEALSIDEHLALCRILPDLRVQEKIIPSNSNQVPPKDE